MSVACTVPRVWAPCDFTVGGGTHDQTYGSRTRVLRRIVLLRRARLRLWPRRFRRRRASAAPASPAIFANGSSARVEAPSDIILAASDEQVQVLATRYGARVKKRLRNAAVLEVTGGQLRDLSEDADVSSVSGDLRGADDGDA